MIMCVLLCYPVSIHMSQLQATGRPISSFTCQECNDILQFMCCQLVPKFTRHVLCLIFFLYIYVALYKLYVLFCVCLFVLLQFCTMSTRNK